MGELVNLRRRRKALNRAAAAEEGARNRAAFGRTAADKAAAAAETARSEAALDRHRREQPRDGHGD